MSDSTMSKQKLSILKVLLKNKRSVACCIYGCLATLTFGFSTGLLLGLPAFRKQFGKEYNGEYIVPAIYQSVWNTLSIPATVFGSLCAGPIGNRLGRKFMFIIGNFIVLTGVLAQHLALNWRILAVGRFLCFLGMSMFSVATPTYVSEVAPPEIRGMMLAQINFIMLIGQFITSCVLRGTQSLPGNLSFRVPIILQYIVPTLLLTFTWFLPESPSWLVRHGRIDAARRSLRRLNGPTADIEKLLNEIQNQKDKEQHNSGVKYLACFKGSNLRRTIIATGTYFTILLAGEAFIFGYTTYFFILSGIQESQAFTITAIMFGLQALANILASYLIERVGRRAMLLTGISVIILSLFAIGIIGTGPSYTTGALPKVIATLMVILTIACQLSVGSVGWVVSGEVSALELRASTQSVNVAFCASFGAAILFTLPYMLNPDQGNLGPKVGFVFGSLSVLSLIFVFFMVPEMKGRTFGELDYMFQHRIPTRKFKGFVIPADREVESEVLGEKLPIVHVTEKAVAVGDA